MKEKLTKIHRDEKKLIKELKKEIASVQLCATPETAAHQAPLSVGFARQEYWSIAFSIADC